jgi:hypothetical protein
LNLRAQLPIDERALDTELAQIEEIGVLSADRLREIEQELERRTARADEFEGVQYLALHEEDFVFAVGVIHDVADITNFWRPVLLALGGDQDAWGVIFRFFFLDFVFRFSFLVLREKESEREAPFVFRISY